MLKKLIALLKERLEIAPVETVTLMAIITYPSHKNSSLDNYIAAGTFIKHLKHLESCKAIIFHKYSFS